MAESEPQVIERVLAGDREASADLIRRYNQRLYRIAWAITRDGAEAEDVVQESWLRAFQRLEQLEDFTRFSGWLARLTANEALLRLRRKSASSAHEILSDTEAEIAASTYRNPAPDDPESLTARRELRPLLESAVADLPEAFRVVFVLREVEGMSVAEIGECLGIPEATVKTRAFRARALLRERLSRWADANYPEMLTFAGERCAALTDHILTALARRAH